MMVMGHRKNPMRPAQVERFCVRQNRKNMESGIERKFVKNQMETEID